MPGLSAQSFTQACRDGGRHIEHWLRVVDREHGARFYREAAAALRSWQAAEDVVQDAMVKVWQRCATFHGAGDPLAWIHQVVRNTLLDALRQRRPMQELSTLSDDDTPPELQAELAEIARQHNHTPEQQVSEKQREAVFRACFAAFARAHPEHATVLRWVVEDGLDNAEVQALLGRSAGATREFISQCRKKARPYFAPWYELAGAP